LLLRAPAARFVPVDLRAEPRDVEPVVFPAVVFPAVRPVERALGRAAVPRRWADFEPRAELALERRAAVRGVVERRPYSP
jgi:hypothetical protein